MKIKTLKCSSGHFIPAINIMNIAEKSLNNTGIKQQNVQHILQKNFLRKHLLSVWIASSHEFQVRI